MLGGFLSLLVLSFSFLRDHHPHHYPVLTHASPPLPSKGSISLKSSGRRESILRRAGMRLGGLRVITSGGISAGIDAALYLVGALVSDESANDAAQMLQWTWTKGFVVDGIDV
jgi:hypothetical protein